MTSYLNVPDVQSIPTSLQLGGNQRTWAKISNVLRTGTIGQDGTFQIVFVHGPPGCGKYEGIRILAASLNARTTCVDGSATTAQLIDALKCVSHKALGHQQTVLVLHGLEGFSTYLMDVLSPFCKARTEEGASSSKILVLATSSDPSGVHAAQLSSLKLHLMPFPMYQPSQSQVEALLRIKFGDRSPTCLREAASASGGDLRRACTILEDKAMAAVKGVTADRDVDRTMFQTTERLLRGRDPPQIWAEEARNRNAWSGSGAFTQLLHHNYVSFPTRPGVVDVSSVLDDLVAKADLLSIADTSVHLLDAVANGFHRCIPRTHTDRISLTFPKGLGFGTMTRAFPTKKAGKAKAGNPWDAGDGAFSSDVRRLCGCGTCDTCLRFKCV